MQSKENINRTIPEHFWCSAKGLLEKLKSTVKYKQIVKDIIKTHNIIYDEKKEHIEENVLGDVEFHLENEVRTNPMILDFSKWGKYLPLQYQCEIL